MAMATPGMYGPPPKRPSPNSSTTRFDVECRWRRMKWDKRKGVWA